ncbi:hypothetical protein [Lacrimispora xylanisolvens]|uniref:hypothetical protein n=1 Tax=Lacrimispora xylanisolvens TaxID=384636 RepID=UPI00240285BA
MVEKDLPIWHPPLGHESGESTVCQKVDGWLSPRTRDNSRVRAEKDGTIWIRGDGLDLCSRECSSLLVKFQPDFCFHAEFEMWIPRGRESGIYLGCRCDPVL